MAEDVAGIVEAELARLSRRLTDPGERECLRCFLLRMINEFGCDGTHRWTMRWRDLRAPRARGLVQRMQRRGGCCCDCEVIFNVFPDYPGHRRDLAVRRSAAARFRGAVRPAGAAQERLTGRGQPVPSEPARPYSRRSFSAIRSSARAIGTEVRPTCQGRAP